MRYQAFDGRAIARLAGIALAAILLLGGCNNNEPWHETDISGSSPTLKFSMTRVNDGKAVTADDYKGKIVLLYFGYTFCPDVCPTTLQNASNVLTDLGKTAKDVRFLFVTVDPNRDKPKVLADYVKNFGPQMDGLRGTPDQIVALARRYRIAYSVTPASKDKPYEVTHSSAIYVFDGTGKARLLVSSLGTAQPQTGQVEADLRRLDEEEHPPTLLTRLKRLL